MSMIHTDQTVTELKLIQELNQQMISHEEPGTKKMVMLVALDKIVSELVEEAEADGQPSEAQEWRDYNAAC